MGHDRTWGPIPLSMLAIGLLLGYATTAYADAVGFAQGIGAIPAKAWAIATVAALAGGLTNIVMGISNAEPPVLPSLFAVSRSLFLSLAAGAIGFMTGLQLGIPPEAMMLTVAGSGLAGTTVIEALRKRITKQADKLA